jgi:hypothetical protein
MRRRLSFPFATSRRTSCAACLTSTGSLPGSPRYRLRPLQRGFTIQRLWPEPPGWDVVPVDELAGPIVLKQRWDAAAICRLREDRVLQLLERIDAAHIRGEKIQGGRLTPCSNPLSKYSVQSCLWSCRRCHRLSVLELRKLLNNAQEASFYAPPD